MFSDNSNNYGCHALNCHFVEGVDGELLPRAPQQPAPVQPEIIDGGAMGDDEGALPEHSREEIAAAVHLRYGREFGRRRAIKHQGRVPEGGLCMDELTPVEVALMKVLPYLPESAQDLLLKALTGLRCRHFLVFFILYFYY